MQLATMSESIPAHARRALISELVQERGSITTAELTARFGITDTSIRHDLEVLEQVGKARRVRGGAVDRWSAAGNWPVLARSRENWSEKKRIAATVAGMVKAGEVVFLDSGSTVACTAVAMRAAFNGINGTSSVTVVTHSELVIEEVGTWTQPHLVCLGGLYLPDHRAAVGPMTLANLTDLTADVAILGCDGLTVEGGLTTPHMLIAEVGATMAAHARRVIVVADASKLGRIGFTRIVALETVTSLVTDDRADKEFVQHVNNIGVEVVIA